MIANFKMKYNNNNIELIESTLYIEYNAGTAQTEVNLFYVLNDEYKEELTNKLGLTLYNKIINKLIYEQSKVINELRKNINIKEYRRIAKLNTNDILYSPIYNNDNLINDSIRGLYKDYSLKSAYEYAKAYYSELLDLQQKGVN